MTEEEEFIEHIRAKVKHQIATGEVERVEFPSSPGLIFICFYCERCCRHLAWNVPKGSPTPERAKIYLCDECYEKENNG